MNNEEKVIVIGFVSLLLLILVLMCITLSISSRGSSTAGQHNKASAYVLPSNTVEDHGETDIPNPCGLSMVTC